MQARKVLARGLAAILAAAAIAPAHAEDEPRRTRITLGPQVYPSFPGSDEFDVGPMVDVSRARGDKPFAFEAPDESFGFAVVKIGGFKLGPVVNWEGTRTASDVGAALPKVKFSVEPGLSAQVAERR